MEPIGYALTGEFGSGKSRLVEQFSSAFPPYRDSEGRYTPILVAKVPAIPTIKGMSSILLDKLGDNNAHKLQETEIEKSNRLQVMLRECKVNALILDEFQHFADKNSRNIILHVSNWLKMIIDDARIMAVLVGLDYSREILLQNVQLARRFAANLELSRFDWNTESSREEFKAVLDAFARGMYPFSLPDLRSDEMAFKFYVGTGGLISYITKDTPPS